MEDEIWITPKDAELLVASYQGRGSILAGDARAKILSWIGQDQVRALALEATRWVDEAPRPPLPSVPQPEREIGDSDDGDLQRAPAYRVNGAFSPVDNRQLPLVKLQCTDYLISLEDWGHAAAAGFDDGQLWSASEFTHLLRGQRNPLAYVVYAGVRLARSDIERRIEIAGWPEPKGVATPKASDSAATSNDSGRRPANWWPDFAEELAVYIHEAGTPDGEGQAGQSAMIDDIFKRLNARGKDEPSRTTVQPVIRAVLSRLRSAEN